MERVGVFICHCGINIASTVDVEKLTEQISTYPGVVHACNYTYTCSTPGQQMIVEDVGKHNLTRVVVASCSPRMHLVTFQRAVEKAGLNPYLFEMANIREHCSWVHSDKEVGTAKALEIIQAAVCKVITNQPLVASTFPVTKRALVVGAGIAGIQAALDIAAGGIEVVLVEREPAIGGHMAQLAETFPTLDCASCIFTPKVVEVAQNENIRLYAYSEIEELSGNVGDFTVKIRKKARYVDDTKCTGCGTCQERCPTKVASEFDRGIGMRKAIYIPYPQAIPKVPRLDAENCIYKRKGKCGICSKVCEAQAVDYEQEDEIIEEKVGVVVVATGFELLPKTVYGEYGYGKYEDVIDGLQFERILSASGPFAGEIKRPSDGAVPKEMVFIQCVGSRDESKGIPYCSRVCCMYTAKHARLYKHRVHDGQAYVFYMDIRAGGKKYEEFVKAAIIEEGAVYLRGRVSSVVRSGGKLIVQGVDTLAGTQVEIKADMVVLACAVVPHPSTEDLARRLRISFDENGFLTESHVKLKPVESTTAGIFLVGMCQAPKDIPDVVAQAGCAAAKVLALFSHEELTMDPMIAEVVTDICSGCGICVAACPYDARVIDERRRVAKIKEVLCQGCGACVSACPNGASQQKNLRVPQILSMVDAMT